MMARPFLALKLKDPQAYYYSDETIPCILELRTERPLRDPLIRIIFKGISRSFISARSVHTEKIFAIEQQIKRNDIEPKKTLEIEFSVDPMKGVNLPSFCTHEGVDGGKIEYMVEAILETTRFMGQKKKTAVYLPVPLIAKVNIAELHLREPKQTTTEWPKIEDEINKCRLHANIRRSGWMRGRPIQVQISWKQPERYLSAKKVELALIKQELISASKDRPPNMSFRLSDKPVVKVPKELRLERDQRNQAMVTNGIFEIDIPPTITPTINGNGKTVQIDYKLCVTVFLPEMGAYNQDREVSVNLDVVIGTVYENGSFDISNEIERLSISSNDSTSAAAGGGYVIQTDRVGNNNREMPSQNDYVQRNVTHQSPTTYYIPDQMLGHSQSTPPPQPPTQNNPVYPPYPVNTGYTPVPTINTGIPPQTPTHGGYPPNTHPGFSPSTNQTYQEFRGNREENRSSIKYQTIPNITPETTPPRKPQQLNIYPPPDNFEHELPMALNSHDEEVMNLNRKIEKSVYPPLQHDSEPMDMASPACYMDQYPNQYFEFQESASDENTTLSSKNSCRNNDKTQP